MKRTRPHPSCSGTGNLPVNDRNKRPYRCSCGLRTPALLIATTILAMCRATAQPGKTDSLEIRVMVSFVVEKDSSISNIQVLKTDCNCSKKMRKNIAEEVKQIIRQQPLTPRSQNGKPARTFYRQPVVIKITGEAEGG